MSAEDEFVIVSGTERAAPTPRARTLRKLPWSASEEGARYVLSDELAVVVNTALSLRQPLLVTGEPGCGKTALAYAVAHQLQTEVLTFNTRSTSSWEELFYEFDTLRRFRDAHVQPRNALAATDSIEEHKLLDLNRYVTDGPLGRAIKSDRTVVVLIDEIDKAPRDFPNDLLRAIQEPMSYRVKEIPGSDEHLQWCSHFVLITSNGERSLPAPFLRRCVFHHLEFPSQAALEAILDRHLGPRDAGRLKGVDRDPVWRPAVVAAFAQVRARLAGSQRTEVRLPGTAELIAWARALASMNTAVDDVRAVGATPGVLPPAAGVLLKSKSELDRFVNRR